MISTIQINQSTAAVLIALVFLACCNKSGASAGAGKPKPGGPPAATVNTATGDICPSSATGQGIRYTESSASEKVMNGSAYDCAALNIKGISKLIVPADAEVDSGSTQGVIMIRMRKSVSFMGHPPKMVTPYVARSNMGCAWKAESDVLLIGTYGEWDSHIEGGASTHLAITTPPGLSIEKRENLSGEASSAASKAPPVEDEHWHWYASGSPEAGWEKIDSIPDEAYALESEEKQKGIKQGSAGD